MKRPEYNELLRFYLEHNTSGILGEFNKKYFPKDYKDMKKELEELEPCFCYYEVANSECQKHKG